ncbi:MAG: wax ester/triacylglycerol synthase family O-acyltransferase, partial [Pseudonocardia sp.]|nr:wax ester/triacylglycerol synthase family O-acyltransferase [Pseudonocardia sp.]
MPAVRAGGERMTVFDLAELASDVGPNARNVGVMIELEGGAPGLDAVRASVGDGVGLVPRLAQRMRRVPLGCGRPVWEDVAVYLDHHVRPGPPTRRTCSTSPPRLLFEALDPAHPWWTLTVVDLPAAGRCALVWSSHHAMADGPSVLRAVLPLVQDGPTRELPPPRTVPGRARLAREAWAARVRVLG